MNDRTSHVLDAIDGALTDYSLSADAMRWTPEPQRAHPTGLRLTPGRIYVAPSSEQIRVSMLAFSESFQRAASQMAEAFARIAEEINRAKPLLQDAGILPETPPDEPRARALWLRQHRNTGPSRDVVHQRRPRRAVHLG